MTESTLVEPGGPASGAGGRVEPAAGSDESRRARSIGWIPVAFAVVAEAAWISVIAGVVQEYALREPVLGVGQLVVFVAAGTTAARFVAPRSEERWPLLALILVAGGAVVGVMLSDAARAAVVDGNPVAALGANPGGLAAGLAVLRGFAHGRRELGLGTVARMVFVGIPGLGLAAALGGMVADPFRAGFLADTAAAVAIFAASGLLSLAFAGFAEIERSNAPTWRGNPAWVGLLLVAVAALVATSMPMSALAGPAIATAVQIILGVALVPLAIVGLVAGAGAGLRRTLVFMAVASLVVWILSGVRFEPPADPAGTGGVGAGGGPPSVVEQVGLLGSGLLVLVLVAIGVVLLARAWMRRGNRDRTGDLGDERSFDLPEQGSEAGGRPRRRRGRFGTPATAAEAYLQLVRELAGRDSVRRAPGETPAEHARRLRRIGESKPHSLSLELLAADYGLASFAEASLTAPEHRRAIGRWRALRRELGRFQRTPDEDAALEAALRGDSPAEGDTETDMDRLSH